MAHPERTSRLTPRQEQFVQEYVICLNATQAATRAGYSTRTAYAQGHRLLKKAEVATALTATRAAGAARAQITVETVLQGLYEEARFYGEGSSHGARVAAWIALGKHLGMFVPKAEPVNGEVTELRWEDRLLLLRSTAAPALLERAEPALDGQQSSDGM